MEPSSPSLLTSFLTRSLDSQPTEGSHSSDLDCVQEDKRVVSNSTESNKSENHPEFPLQIIGNGERTLTRSNAFYGTFPDSLSSAENIMPNGLLTNQKASKTFSLISQSFSGTNDPLAISGRVIKKTSSKKSSKREARNMDRMSNHN